MCKELHNKDFKLCKADVRKDVECDFGERCQFEHCGSLAEIPGIARQKALVAHVDKTPGLSFVNTDQALLDKLRA